MTHEELHGWQTWECLKPGGFYELLTIQYNKVEDAGYLYKKLIGRSTGTAKQILRNDGWEINVYTYNSKGTLLKCP